METLHPEPDENTDGWALPEIAEHCHFRLGDRLHTAGVAGSNPAAPTIYPFISVRCNAAKWPPLRRADLVTVMETLPCGKVSSEHSERIM